MLNFPFFEHFAIKVYLKSLKTLTKDKKKTKIFLIQNGKHVMPSVDLQAKIGDFDSIFAVISIAIAQYEQEVSILKQL